MKKLFTFLALAIAIGLSPAAGQNCSFTLLNSDSSCVPMPILAYATDTGAAACVTSRTWQVTTCNTNTVVYAAGPTLSPNFSYIPSVGGCYNITMVSASCHGTCTYQTSIFVSDTPTTGNITIAPTPFCSPQTVNLTMQNTTTCGTIDSVNVLWGCGPISFLSGNPTAVSHLYSGNCFNQCYDVIVKTKNSCGCWGTKRVSNAVCISPPPHANFSADVTSGVCVQNLTTHFTADSAGTGYTYCWYVNGTQSQCNTSRFFTHSFAAGLNCYTIKLVVANNSGCTDSVERNDFICVYAAPQLSITQNATSVCIDSGQNFSLCLGNHSQPFLPNPTWKLRGGTPAVNLGPFYGDSICVPLTRKGTYDVVFIASYGANCTDSLVVPGAFTLKYNPVACFNASDTFTCAQNLCTTFTNCSTPAGSTYQWNFGAGAAPSSSSVRNPPQVCYFGLGTRNVSLNVTAPNGCSKLLVKNNYIVVDTLKPLIYVANNRGCVPLNCVPQSVTFLPPGSPFAISSYAWYIYNSVTNTLLLTHAGSAFPVFITTPGCYDIKLVITTSNGCVCSKWLYNAICAGTPPLADLTISPGSAFCATDTAHFVVAGPSPIDELIIHYGDEVGGNLYTTENYTPDFSHLYTQNGNFAPWVIPAYNGCRGDTLQQIITIYSPVANFTTATSCLSGDTVTFENLTAGANRFHWSFGCRPDTFSTRSPVLLMPHCDTCTVNLTAYNDTVHCSFTKTEQITTACAGVEASFSPDTVGICYSSQLIQFRNTTPGALSGQTQWDFGDGTTRTGNSVIENFVPGAWNVCMTYTAPGGCKDTTCGLVALCNMHIDFTPTSGCLPDAFHFSPLAFDTTAVGGGCDSIVAWQWTFGDGETDNSQYPVHFYTTGTYTVTLRATNQYGCFDVVSKTITVGTPVYDYWTVDSTICPGSTVCINNNTSSGATLTENWSFAGANLGSYTGHNPPCLTYATAGDYPLIYHYSAGSCNQTDTVIIHVHQPQVSGYLTANYASCANPPFVVCAVNTSQYTDVNTDVYSWDFSNGEYQEFEPCDFFTQGGCYPVRLTVLTNNGCSDTAYIDTVCIGGPFVSSYTVNPTAICACQDTVYFTIATVGASQASVVYGCNQGFDVLNPITVGTELNPTILRFDVPYCLTDSCRFQVVLRDSSGCESFFSLPAVYIDSPRVDFNINSYGVCNSGTVCFSDTSQFGLPAGISYNTNWHWTFGNPLANDTSNLANPCHYYAQPGTYPVTLEVRSNFGCEQTISKTVTIHGYPSANFSYQLTADTCQTANVCFTDLSAPDNLATLTNWQWCFGDGNCEFTPGNVCHRYANETTYPATLTVTDEAGCTSDTTLNVLVPRVHHVGITAVVSSTLDSCDYTRVCLTSVNNGEAAISTYQWNVGGQTFSQAAACYPYTAGNYTANLTVTDAVGCTASGTVSFITNPPLLQAGFSFNVSGYTVQFGNVSEGNILNSQWQFGDGATSFQTNPTHTYAPGIYNVTLTVTDAGGCAQSITQTITILVSGVANVSANSLAVSVVPNPFSDFTILKVNGEAGEYELELLNLSGQQVLSGKVQNNQPYRLDRNKLAAGNYICQIRRLGLVVSSARITIR
jgi:PKD repeat protein